MCCCSFLLTAASISKLDRCCLGGRHFLEPCALDSNGMARMRGNKSHLHVRKLIRYITYLRVDGPGQMVVVGKRRIARRCHQHRCANEKTAKLSATSDGAPAGAKKMLNALPTSGPSELPYLPCDGCHRTVGLLSSSMRLPLELKLLARRTARDTCRIRNLACTPALPIHIWTTPTRR
ncbi:hypothetical protein BU23DRAFT_277813 [Bimuria novae-zelandiae CBS 107.79]|uniref:Uncharacterized protein n=1 Tax=Bimuria novae-zelandiae CBS 107.79 TaxID=1447943 RepID=A0A6A5UW42_9PLEO|nr:hypothetical protein BU23DRAFT_277813 [Bimuria novae-zelandiae CBS 107.79]